MWLRHPHARSLLPGRVVAVLLEASSPQPLPERKGLGALLWGLLSQKELLPKPWWHAYAAADEARACLPLLTHISWISCSTYQLCCRGSLWEDDRPGSWSWQDAISLCCLACSGSSCASPVGNPSGLGPLKPPCCCEPSLHILGLEPG